MSYLTVEQARGVEVKLKRAADAKDCAYQNLWLAVITQTVRDLGSTRKVSDREARRSVEWVFTPNEDFERVCFLAGLEAGYVRRIITEAKESKRAA